jgi:hypothetical protein
MGNLECGMRNVEAKKLRSWEAEKLGSKEAES